MLVLGVCGGLLLLVLRRGRVARNSEPAGSDARLGSSPARWPSRRGGRAVHALARRPRHPRDCAGRPRSRALRRRGDEADRRRTGREAPRADPPGTNLLRRRSPPAPMPRSEQSLRCWLGYALVPRRQTRASPLGGLGRHLGDDAGAARPSHGYATAGGPEQAFRPRARLPRESLVTRDLAVLALANVALLVAGARRVAPDRNPPGSDRPAVVARCRLCGRRGRSRRVGIGVARPRARADLVAASAPVRGVARSGSCAAATSARRGASRSRAGCGFCQPRRWSCWPF